MALLLDGAPTTSGCARSRSRSSGGCSTSGTPAHVLALGERSDAVGAGAGRRAPASTPACGSSASGVAEGDRPELRERVGAARVRELVVGDGEVDAVVERLAAQLLAG